MKSILIICSFMIAHPAFSQLVNRLDSVINSSIQSGEPGIALYVESKGNTLYKKGFGLAGTEVKKNIGPNTNFRLASVTKQFTAMCILLLEKDKKLSFEDPISLYFPELPSVIGNKILIRHLITHSSGIMDYEEIMDNSGSVQLLDIDVLNLLNKQEKTYFEPGSQFRYSNSGYALLALIVERVSGQTFPQFMKERIFKPLKMKNSLVYEPDVNIPNRSMGFARDKNNKLFANDQSLSSAVKGDGGVYTSLNEYEKWTEALWKGKLLDMPEILSRLNFPIKEVTGSFYGPGWFYFDKGSPALFHSGSTCGFSTFSVNIPAQKTSIVFLSNIAGNSESFKKILEVLSSEGICNPAQVFELHQLTR